MWVELDYRLKEKQGARRFKFESVCKLFFFYKLFRSFSVWREMIDI